MALPFFQFMYFLVVYSFMYYIQLTHDFIDCLQTMVEYLDPWVSRSKGNPLASLTLSKFEVQATCDALKMNLVNINIFPLQDHSALMTSKFTYVFYVHIYVL